MAEIIRYVNTASTPGGDGTTNAITGINRAYASMSECEAAEQSDFVTATDNLVIYAEGAESGTVTAVTFDGSVTSALYDIKVVGNLNYSTTSSQSYGRTLLIGDDYITLSGIEVGNTNDNNGRCIDIPAAYGAVGTKILGCTINKNTGSGNPGGATCGILLESPQDTVIANNMIYGDMSEGVRIFLTTDNAATHAVYNNTMYGKDISGSSGIRISGQISMTFRVFNNILYVPAGTCYLTDSIGTHVTDANITSDATSPDGVSFQNTTLTYVDAANDNYYLDQSDSAAIDLAVNLSGDAFFPFDYDVAGNLRGALWDIGAHEYQASGNIVVTPNDAEHAHEVTQPTLTVTVAISPDSSEHAHEVTQPTLTVTVAISPDDSEHAHDVTSPNLSLTIALSPEDAEHAQEASGSALSVTVSVTPDNSEHAHEADEVSLTLGLSPNDADHAHEVTEPTLGVTVSMSPDAAEHAHESTEPLFSGLTIPYAPDNSEHAHEATAAPLGNTLALTPFNSEHAQESTEPTLSTTVSMTPDDSEHALESTESVFGITVAMLPEDAEHTHEATEPTLTLIRRTIYPEDAEHAHEAGIAPMFTAFTDISPDIIFYAPIERSITMNAYTKPVKRKW